MKKIPYMGYIPNKLSDSEYLKFICDIAGIPASERQMLDDAEPLIHEFIGKLIKLADKYKGNRNQLVYSCLAAACEAGQLYDFTAYKLPADLTGSPAEPIKNIHTERTNESVSFNKYARKSRTESMFGKMPDQQQLAQKQSETRVKRNDWTGFLHLRCEHCGNEVSFSTKYILSYNKCRNCGKKTSLADVDPRPVLVECKCGKRSRYRTNIKDRTFTINCFSCSCPVDLEENRNGTAYQTIL